MIILDTSVLSAVMSATPDPKVVAWLDRQPAESIWITTITVFEARLELALLPASKRRRALEQSFALLLHDDLEKACARHPGRQSLGCLIYRLT